MVQRKLENGEIVFNHKKGRFVHTDNEDKDYEGKQEMKDESDDYGSGSDDSEDGGDQIIAKIQAKKEKNIEEDK